MRIIWSPEAIADLTNLRDYIARHDPDAAHRVALAIITALELGLAENPEYGRPGRVSDTRELVVPKTPVIVPYRIRNATLEILGVFHHARRWPDHL